MINILLGIMVAGATIMVGVFMWREIIGRSNAAADAWIEDECYKIDRLADMNAETDAMMI